MKNKIILTAITVLMAIALEITVFIINNKQEYNDTENNSKTEVKFEKKDYAQKVSELTEYYNVRNCMNKFFNCCYELNLNKEDAILKEQIYSILSQDYIREYSVIKENISENISQYKESIMLINSMYFVQLSPSVCTYFVSGMFVDAQSFETSNFGFVVEVDKNNHTFSIALEDYFEGKGYENITDNATVNIEEKVSIENRIYNSYEETSVTITEYAIDLFNHYKNNMLFNTEASYDMLYGEYREEKFNNIGQYLEYIKENRSNIEISELNSYQSKNCNSYTEYIFKDNNENYYVFYVDAIMSYKVILDTYTINLPEFIEKYNLSNENNKAMLNIGKFISSLNCADYKYAYSCLYDEFKNNNFASEAEFEEYINKTLYKKIKVKYGRPKNEGYIYICDIEISNAIDDESPTINMQVIIELQEDAKFTLSFSIL